MSVRLVALGDSISCGEGVGLRLPAAATWPSRLTAAVPGGQLTSLAVPGAGVRDVLHGQVLRATTLQPDVTTLLVGLNDVSRGGFDAHRIVDDLRAALILLLRTGTQVLLGRLHDPALLLPLPPALRRTVRARTAAVNAAVDGAAARWSAVEVLDLGAVPGLRARRAWDVDRLHPNAAGHSFIAEAAADVLRGTGLEVGRPPTMPLPPAPRAVEEARWALGSGLPWLAGHVPQVVAPALAVSLRGRLRRSA